MLQKPTKSTCLNPCLHPPPSCKLRQGSTSSTVFLQIYIHVSRRKHSNAWDRKAKKSCTKLLSPEQERRRQQWKAAQVKKRHREAWRHAGGIRRCFEIIFGAGRVQLILETPNKHTLASTKVKKLEVPSESSLLDGFSARINLFINTHTFTRSRIHTN